MWLYTSSCLDICVHFLSQLCICVSVRATPDICLNLIVSNPRRDAEADDGGDASQAEAIVVVLEVVPPHQNQTDDHLRKVCGFGCVRSSKSLVRGVSRRVQLTGSRELAARRFRKQVGGNVGAVGALKIRIGLRALSTIVLTRNPPKK